MSYNTPRKRGFWSFLFKKKTSRVRIPRRNSSNRYFARKYSTNYFKDLLESKRDIIISPNILKFNSFLDFNESIEKFKKHFGKPLYTYNSEYNHNVKTLVYKTKIRNIDAKCSLIFNDGKLVMFNYIFTNLSSKKYNRIMDYAVAKYGSFCEDSNYKIMDKNSNFLNIVHNRKQISFNYFSASVEKTSVFEEKRREQDYTFVIHRLKTSI